MGVVDALVRTASFANHTRDQADEQKRGRHPDAARTSDLNRSFFSKKIVQKMSAAIDASVRTAVFTKSGIFTRSSNRIVGWRLAAGATRTPRAAPYGKLLIKTWENF